MVQYERMITNYYRSRIQLSATTQGAPARPTSYFNAAAAYRVRGLVNPKGFPRVSIPYGKRTRVASTNVPGSSHYSTDPPTASPDFQWLHVSRCWASCLSLQYSSHIIQSSKFCLYIPIPLLRSIEYQISLNEFTQPRIQLTCKWLQFGNVEQFFGL